MKTRDPYARTGLGWAILVTLGLLLALILSNPMAKHDNTDIKAEWERRAQLCVDDYMVDWESDFCTFLRNDTK